MSDLPGIDRYKLASDPEYGEAPVDDEDEAWCDICCRKTGDVRCYLGELVCERCIEKDKLEEL